MGRFDCGVYELRNTKMVTACLDKVGCLLKLNLHIFVSVTNESEMLNSQALEKIQNTAIGIYFVDSFACPCSIHSFRSEKPKKIFLDLV
jgi:hypothetical protein